VIDLAGIDQVLALAPAEVDAVPFPFLERRAGDGQGLALRAGLLHPVVAAAAGVAAVAHLRYDAFSPSLQACANISPALDLETFAELDIGAGHDRLQFGLAANKRLLAEVAAFR
jgi:hypothetical protein